MSTFIADGARVRARRFVAVLIAVVGLLVGLLAMPARAAVEPLPNPPFPDECGIDVAIVLDTSNSIARDDPGNPQLMKDAAKVVVDALTGTPSRVGVFSFRTLATTEIGYTDIADAGNAATVNAAIDATDFTITGATAPNPGGTNWEAGFLEAGTSADIIIFATDGNPTTRNEDVANDPGQTADPEDLDAGITAANAAKAAGAKVIAVGIGGSVIQANLLAISGPVANDDYYLADFDTLASSLRQIALRLCAPSVTVKKLIGDTPTAGWEFTAVTDPAGVPVVVNPAGGVTNGSGVVNFKWDSLDPIGVTLTETPQSGFALDSVTCSNQFGTPIQTTPIANGVTLTLTLEDIATCDFVNLANEASIDVVKVPDVTVAGIGDTVTYTYTATNTGPTTLEDVTVTDDLLGPVTLAATTLAPGASTTGTLTYTVQASDLPGPIVNVALASGINPDFPDDPVTASDDATVDVEGTAGLSVVKVSDVTIAQVGDVITYTYTVTNTGDLDLTGVTVTDDILGPITLASTSLAAGESTTGTAQHTVTAADLAGPIVNVATATGTDPEGTPLTSTDDATVGVAAIDLVKVPDVSEAGLGDVVTYTYTVTNTGSVTLVDLVLTDDVLGPITLGTTTLAPGASTTGVASHVVTEADGTGPIVNVAIVTGQTEDVDPGTQLPVTVTDTDTASVAVIIVLPTTIATTTTAATTTSDVLPETGLDTNDAAGWGIALLALGLVLVTVGRDRVWLLARTGRNAASKRFRRLR